MTTSGALLARYGALIGAGVDTTLPTPGSCSTQVRQVSRAVGGKEMKLRLWDGWLLEGRTSVSRTKYSFGI